MVRVKFKDDSFATCVYYVYFLCFHRRRHFWVSSVTSHCLQLHKCCSRQICGKLNLIRVYVLWIWLFLASWNKSRKKYYIEHPGPESHYISVLDHKGFILISAMRRALIRALISHFIVNFTAVNFKLLNWSQVRKWKQWCFSSVDFLTHSGLSDSAYSFQVQQRSLCRAKVEHQILVEVKSRTKRGGGSSWNPELSIIWVKLMPRWTLQVALKSYHGEFVTSSLS